MVDIKYPQKIELPQSYEEWKKLIGCLCVAEAKNDYADGEYCGIGVIEYITKEEISFVEPLSKRTIIFEVKHILEITILQPMEYIYLPSAFSVNMR